MPVENQPGLPPGPLADGDAGGLAAERGAVVRLLYPELPKEDVDYSHDIAWWIGTRKIDLSQYAHGQNSFFHSLTNFVASQIPEHWVPGIKALGCSELECHTR